MNDYLFEHQDALAPRELIAGAVLLGLDIDRFTDDRRRHTYAERVREDFLSGVRSGVNGTPIFFISGFVTTAHSTSIRFRMIGTALLAVMSVQKSWSCHCRDGVAKASEAGVWSNERGRLRNASTMRMTMAA